MNLNNIELDENKINMIKYRILMAEEDNIIAKNSESAMVDIVRNIINEEVGKKD